MGACVTYNSRNHNSDDRLRLHRQGNLTFHIHSKSNLAVLTVGRGCKMTPAWETDLTKDQITEKIKEFWETRVDGNPKAWEVLRKAVEEPDLKKAEHMVKAFGLTLNDGLISLCYDERGHRFELPPFVLNPATKYKEETPQKPKEILKVDEFPISLRAAGLNDVQIVAKTDQKIKDIKEKYLENIQQKKNIRLFFNGKEMRDDKLLGEFPVNQNHVLQVFIKN